MRHTPEELIEALKKVHLVYCVSGIETITPLLADRTVRVFI